MYYGYEKVNGPYTQMLRKGIPKSEIPEIPAGTAGSDFKSVR